MEELEPVVEEKVAEEVTEPVKVEEPIVDNSVDENGVPWKNRAMEAKRKQEELEQNYIVLVEDDNDNASSSGAGGGDSLAFFRGGVSVF